MNRLFLILFLIINFTLFYNVPRSNAQNKVDRLILISLDGVRTQELFQGLDVDLLMKKNQGKKKEDLPLYQKYFGNKPKESREKLMPFFWKEWIPNHGVVIGNRHSDSNNTMKLLNRRRFSFPGYNEILSGTADDKRINSNSKIQNPNSTVLDFLKTKWNLTENQIACFASWDVFPYIVSSEFGSIYTNAGFADYPFGTSEKIKTLNAAQFEQPTPWDSVRHDYTTFSFALDFMKRNKPKVMYLSLGETDDWAHNDRYDRVLETLNRTDNYFKVLWNYLQSEEFYKDRTGVIICTDHGRGDNIFNWMSHNDKLPGAEYVWMAVISPNVEQRGEWRPSNSNTISQSQIASTLCALAGLNYLEFKPKAGEPISEIIKN